MGLPPPQFLALHRLSGELQVRVSGYFWWVSPQNRPRGAGGVPSAHRPGEGRREQCLKVKLVRAVRAEAPLHPWFLFSTCCVDSPVQVPSLWHLDSDVCPMSGLAGVPVTSVFPWGWRSHHSLLGHVSTYLIPTPVLNGQLGGHWLPGCVQEKLCCCLSKVPMADSVSPFLQSSPASGSVPFCWPPRSFVENLRCRCYLTLFSPPLLWGFLCRLGLWRLSIPAPGY